MAVAGFDLFYPRPIADNAASVNPTGITINAANEAVGCMYPAPHTGNVAKVHFFTATVFGSGDADVRIETIGTDGFPSGTLYGTNSNGAVTISSSTTLHSVTLTTAVAVIRGDPLAVVIRADATTPANGQIRLSIAGGISNPSYPTVTTDLVTPPGNWVDIGSNQAPNIILEYDDGVVYHVPGVYWMQGTRHETYGSGSSPDEVGIVIQVPFRCQVSGVWADMQLTNAGSSLDFILYDENDNVLASRSHDTDLGAGTSASSRNGVHYGIFAPDVLIEPNIPHRITAQATGAGTFILRGAGSTNTTLIGALEGGSNIYKTERTNAGAWTDTTTDRMFMGLVISGVAFSGGPLVNGGLVW